MRLLGHTTVAVAIIYQVASDQRDREGAARLDGQIKEHAQCAENPRLLRPTGVSAQGPRGSSRRRLTCSPARWRSRAPAGHSRHGGSRRGRQLELTEAISVQRTVDAEVAAETLRYAASN